MMYCVLWTRFRPMSCLKSRLLLIRWTKLQRYKTWNKSFVTNDWATAEIKLHFCTSLERSNGTKLNISNITKEWTWIRILAKNINIQEQKRFSPSLTFYSTKYVTKLPYRPIFLPIYLLAHWDSYSSYTARQQFCQIWQRKRVSRAQKSSSFVI